MASVEARGIKNNELSAFKPSRACRNWQNYTIMRALSRAEDRSFKHQGEYGKQQQKSAIVLLGDRVRDGDGWGGKYGNGIAQFRAVHQAFERLTGHWSVVFRLRQAVRQGSSGSDQPRRRMAHRPQRLACAAASRRARDIRACAEGVRA